MTYPDSKVHGANMGPTWVLLAPGGPHAGLINLSIWVAANRKSQGISNYSIDPVLLEYSSLITVAANYHLHRDWHKSMPNSPSQGNI